MKSNTMAGPAKAPDSYLVRRVIQPHILIFFLLQLLYFVPLCVISFNSYDKGGVLTIGTDAQLVIGKIAVVYVTGFFAFCLGSWSAPIMCWLLGSSWTKTASIAKVSLFESDYLFLFLMVGAFIVSKLLLIREGIYSNYAFDTGGMDSPAWTASMFLSETLALASIIMLFSAHRKNVRNFFLLSALNGVNLLHGTRNLLVIAIIAIAAYVYVRTSASLIKLFVYGLGVFLGAASLAYLIFISRSHIADASFTFLDILSPIVFESVFSQISLIALFNHPGLISPLGSPLHFLQDIAIFSVPRVFIDNKGGSLWLSQFAYLSPLGAFNGFAAGLLYFGFLYPAFYYLAGLMAGVLYRNSRRQFGAVVYLYVICDFLYRIMRDGYIIPFKMLINVLEILLLLALARVAHRALRKTRLDHSLAKTGELI